MNLNDVIDNVLADGASVEAVDFKSWSAAILKNCDSSKLKVLQSELDGKVLKRKHFCIQLIRSILQSADKWAEIGFVKGTPKVFVKLGQGYQKNIKVFKLELLDADSLQHYPKDGRHLIAYAEGKGEKDNKWVIEAHVRVLNGVVAAIEASVKASTSKRASIREIPVSLVNGAIEFGEPVTLQNDNPVVEKKYVIPAAKSTGPNLDTEAAADANIPKEKQPPQQAFAAVCSFL